MISFCSPDGGRGARSAEREGRSAEREGRSAEREGRSAEREGRSAEREARSTEREAHEGALRAFRSGLSSVRRRLGRFVLLLCLLAPSAAGAYFAARYASARYHRQAAQSALEQHDFLQAQDHLKQCLTIRGDPATAF